MRSTLRENSTSAMHSSQLAQDGALEAEGCIEFRLAISNLVQLPARRYYASPCSKTYRPCSKKLFGLGIGSPMKVATETLVEAAIWAPCVGSQRRCSRAIQL